MKLNSQRSEVLNLGLNLERVQRGERSQERSEVACDTRTNQVSQSRDSQREFSLTLKQRLDIPLEQSAALGRVLVEEADDELVPGRELDHPRVVGRQVEGEERASGNDSVADGSICVTDSWSAASYINGHSASTGLTLPIWSARHRHRPRMRRRGDISITQHQLVRLRVNCKGAHTRFVSDGMLSSDRTLIGRVTYSAREPLRGRAHSNTSPPPLQPSPAGLR